MSSAEETGRQTMPKSVVARELTKPELLGRLDRAIREKLRAIFSYDDALLRDIELEAEALREQLVKEQDHPLERVMADQVVNSWLETAASAYRKSCLPEHDKGRKLAPFLEMQHHQSQARLIRCVETLAKLRTMKVPGEEPEEVLIRVIRE